MVWFYIAQLRARFRLAVAFDLKPDGEPAVYGALFETIGPQINGWAFGDIDSLAAHMQEALDWDSSHANAFTPKADHAAELEEVRSGLAAFRANVLARKEELRRDRRQTPREPIGGRRRRAISSWSIEGGPCRRPPPQRS